MLWVGLNVYLKYICFGSIHGSFYPVRASGRLVCLMIVSHLAISAVLDLNGRIIDVQFLRYSESFPQVYKIITS